MATIKDVARLAGVSPSTASRAMHGNPVISEKTRRRVVKAMEELNYAPDFNAQNLAQKSSNTVGVILPTDHHEIFNNPFFLEMVRGINEICYKEAVFVTLATGTSSQELIQNVDVMFQRGNTKKFIILYSEEDDPVLKHLKELPVQFVIIGKPYDHVNETPYVDNDNILAGSDATEYLLSKGHEHICFVHSGLTKMVQADRFAGYRMVIQRRKLQEHSIETDFSDFYGSRDAMYQYLLKNPNISAFIATDDMIGLRLQQILSSTEGINQKDISIVGFNNSVFAEVAHPTLTSVEIFPKRLGQEAARLTLDLNENQPLAAKLIVPHQIVERHSVTNILGK